VVGTSANRRCLVATPALAGLCWQHWDDLYILYQPSSAETHVFNESTAMILRCVQGRSKAPAHYWHTVKERTEAALGLNQGELGADQFEFATRRLEELGLIESVDEAIARR
jgi:PqqD family protein of HPr-rel-A system